MAHYFFIGIAGTGMSAIAQYLAGSGHSVSGSDRLFSSDSKMLIQEQFELAGIKCYFQDGSGVTLDVDKVVVSTAIEATNNEYQLAEQLGIPIMKRSELLAQLSAEKKTIAVGGTSGKSTTSAMIFHILETNGFSPSLMSGAGLSSLQRKGLPGNAWVGQSEWLVIEADESDGSIINYVPEISVVLNLDRDHKELDELVQLFETFKLHTRTSFIVNDDSLILHPLSVDRQCDFGTKNGVGFQGENFSQQGFQISFSINNTSFKVPVIGRHNMENALAAVAVCVAAGASIAQCATALETFEGIYRRTELIGERNGVYVVDDFAHNPSEIAAAIRACQSVGKAVHAWFQPHGYGPLRFMRPDLVHEVSEVLRTTDYFYLSDVYYAGGTVNKDVTSADVLKDLELHTSQAVLAENRDDLLAAIKQRLHAGDVILLMGARDPSLADFARNLLQQL